MRLRVGKEGGREEGREGRKEEEGMIRTCCHLFCERSRNVSKGGKEEGREGGKACARGKEEKQ